MLYLMPGGKLDWLRYCKKKSQNYLLTWSLPIFHRGSEKSSLDRRTIKVASKSKHGQDLGQKSLYRLPFEQALLTPEVMIWSLAEELKNDFLRLGRKRLVKVVSDSCYFYSKKRKEASLGIIDASFSAAQSRDSEFQQAGSIQYN